MNLSLLFPGQGCQAVGMGASLHADYAEARALFEMADDTLGFALSRICFEGPAEVLNDTANTQPAIYASTMALWAVLGPRIEGIRHHVRFLAGHSLGEFSALAAAGALGVADGLRLVRRRGQAMRDAGETAPGGMAAIIGLDDEAVAAIVGQANGDDQGLWMANYNAPGQVVIAGHHDKIARAVELAVERKARKAVTLKVSVACHTPIMRQAGERLAEALHETPLQRPWAPVVSNAEARPLSDPDEIRSALLRQLYSPVRWTESVRLMAADGVDAVLEIGPKAVVSGLVKRIDRSLARYSVTDGESAEALDWEALRA